MCAHSLEILAAIMEDPVNWAIWILWLNESFYPSTEFLHRYFLCLSECIVLPEGIKKRRNASPITHLSVVGNECPIAVVFVLLDDPVPLANGHWFTYFRIELIGGIAEFSDHFVSALPSFKVHGNPCASPGTPCGPNIFEYPSYGSKVAVDGPAESLVILLDGLQQSRSG